MKKFAKVIGLLFLVPVVILMTAWGVCAIYWAEPPAGLLQTVVAAGFGLATAAGVSLSCPTGAGPWSGSCSCSPGWWPGG